MIAGKKSFRLFLTVSAVIASSLFCAAAGSSDIISSGTGFFVNDQGWIVTNQHVVEGCESVSVPSLGDAAEIKIDKQNDLEQNLIIPAHILLRRSSWRTRLV
ncbi:trypsin-like peptidase domain-containing protein [Mesorhizobium sp. PAMC28654]|uniref:trypsin-like peptidase domain-containing protein n=1 Tax=Mesorhizobium sp. PAMC28654 TaxID=2880934 RepID=UPI0039B43370